MNQSNQATEGIAIVGVSRLRQSDEFNTQKVWTEIIDSLLNCARQALEEAGQVGGRAAATTGVFTDFDLGDNALPPQALDFGDLPLLISSRLGLAGPSMNIQCGRSPSLVPAIVACQQLLASQCDLALVGNPALPRGTRIADGGVLALKRLPDALLDRDHIYAVIKEFAIHRDIPCDRENASVGLEKLIDRALVFHNLRLVPDRAESVGQIGDQQEHVKLCSSVTGGTSACLMLEAAPPVPASVTSRPTQLLILSAENEASLEHTTEDLSAHLAGHPEVSLADAGYTLQTRRRALACRRAVVGSSLEEILSALQTLAPENVCTHRLPGTAASVVFLFPPLHQWRPQAGRELYDQEPMFRAQIELCAGLLKPWLDVDFREVLFSAREAPVPGIAQPAQFALEYALAKLWMSWGIRPAAMIGHRASEYVAACLAGVVSLKDVLRLLVFLGRLGEKQPTHGRLMAQIPESEAKTFLNEHIWLASVDAPDLCAFAGPVELLPSVASRLLERGYACQILDDCVPPVAPLKEEAAKRLLTLLQPMKFRVPRIPYISSLTGQWIASTQATDPKYWLEQMGGTVRFSSGVEALLQEPGRIFLEMNLSPGLGFLVHQHAPPQGSPLVLPALDESLRPQTCGFALLRMFGRLWTEGVDVDWEGFHAREELRSIRLPFGFSHSNRESLKTTRPDFETGLTEKDQAIAGNGEARFTRAMPLNGSASSDFTPPAETPTINGLSAAAQPIQRNSIVKDLPLTEAQREIWYATQMADALSCSFNQSAVLHLHGPLDLPRLMRSLEWLVARHDALRATFAPEGDVQHIIARMPVEVPTSELSQIPAALRQEQFNTILADMVKEPFDLERGPLFRLRLAQFEPEHHALVLTLHHLVCDGGSFGVLLQELGERYSADAKGQPGPAEVPQSFSDFVAKQEVDRQGAARTTAEAFWLEQYSRPAPKLELPTDRPRPSQRSFAGGSISTVLNKSLAQELKRFSARQRSTMVTVLLAGYYLLLHRLTGCSEIVVGLPMTDRSGEGGERLVGHCVNFLPLRLSLEGNPLFADYFARVRGLLLDAHEHQGYTLGSLLQKLNLPREPGRMPLVETMFNLAWVREAVKLEGLETRLFPNPYCFTHFDLSVSVAECEGELELHCHYSAELYEPATVQRWLKHFENLLASIVANPDQRIGRLSLLTAAERRQLLVDWARLPQGGQVGETGARRFYVFDGYLEPAPVGVVGDLFVSSPLNASNTTSDSGPSIALPDPFRPEPGMELCRTGRRGRYSAAGYIEILDPDGGPEQTDGRATAIPEPAPPEVRPAAGAIPTATEEKLAEIWREVIGLQAVGREDNFFDLGGHSVLLTQVITRVRKTFGVDLTLRHLFEAPTISELAGIIEERHPHATRGASPGGNHSPARQSIRPEIQKA